MNPLKQHIADGPYRMDIHGTNINSAKDIHIGEWYGDSDHIPDVLNFPAKVLEVLREERAGILADYSVEEMALLYRIVDSCGFSREDVTQ